jgi:hypothetical protein
MLGHSIRFTSWKFYSNAYLKALSLCKIKLEACSWWLAAKELLFP